MREGERGCFAVAFIQKLLDKPQPNAIIKPISQRVEETSRLRELSRERRKTVEARYSRRSPKTTSERPLIGNGDSVIISKRGSGREAACAIRGGTAAYTVPWPASDDARQGIFYAHGRPSAISGRGRPGWENAFPSPAVHHINIKEKRR